MTITYTLEVSKAQFWGFPKLLARWKGSIYRLMYRETCVFLLAYYLIAFIYRYTLPPYFQRQFEKISLYCREFTTLVPITFVLGFYVTFVVGRWWQQYNAIPWPDRLAIQISTYIQGTDDRARMIRRSLIRYANLTALLTFQNTSTVIKQRFPTVNHLVEAGLLTPEEKEELESVVAPHGNWWVPSHWFAQLVAIARKEGRIHDDLHYKSLIDEMLTYRGLCGTVWSYDWISVPLVYTQVVTIAVYSFFFSCLFGRQYLEPYKSEVDIDRNAVDYYFPLFTIFQFVFYVGWLKVAESMICPFGEDDDDFDMNWIIDRNIQVSYLIVDKLFRKFPKLTKDVFWDDVDPELPYTQASSSHRGVPFYGSTVAMSISERNAEWNFPETMPPIDEEAKITSGRHASKHTKDRKFYSAQNSIDANQHKSLFNRATSEQNDKPVMSHGSLSIIDQDDEEDVSIHSSNEDIRSNGSRLIDEKRKRKGLSALLLGFSRNTIASRFGSRNSVASRSSHKTIRSPAENVGRVSRRRGSRHSAVSSPALSYHRQQIQPLEQPVSVDDDTIEASTKVNNETQEEHSFSIKSKEENLFKENAYTKISIEVPPTVNEEPEVEPNRT